MKILAVKCKYAVLGINEYTGDETVLCFDLGIPCKLAREKGICRKFATLEEIKKA